MAIREYELSRYPEGSDIWWVYFPEHFNEVWRIDGRIPEEVTRNHPLMTQEEWVKLLVERKGAQIDAWWWVEAYQFVPCAVKILGEVWAHFVVPEWIAFKVALRFGQKYGHLAEKAAERALQGVGVYTALDCGPRLSRLIDGYPATTYVQRRDPLVLDLDGDGITTTNVHQSRTYFDHDANGFRELTGWVAAGDGVLMIDINGNGNLDNGRELLGDFTILPNGKRAASGFDALAYYDLNCDGRIDAGDPVWSQLRIWQRDASWGYAYQPDLFGQVRPLDRLGVIAIHLDSEICNKTDDAGNTVVRTGRFERQDGSISTITEYSFQRDKTGSIPTVFLDVPPEIAALPNLWGYGNVVGLHQAMVRDSSGQLKALVAEFATAAESTDRNDLLRRILLKWAGTEYAFAPRYLNYDERSLALLEHFFGFIA